jgi:hypothetical protein
MERPRLFGDVLEIDVTAALADDIEEIAMFAGGCVRPFPGWALWQVLKTDVHGAPGRVVRAHKPIAFSGDRGRRLPAFEAGFTP